MVRLHEHIDQQPLDRRPLIGDLVIARRLPPAQLQTVERRLAGRRRAVRASGFQLARQHRHDRIAAQVVVVIEIFIAERDRKHPLAHQGRYRVLDQILAAMIAKAPRKTTNQINRPIGRSQQQASGVRGHQPRIECRFHSPAFDHSKIKPFCATLCLHRGSPSIREKSLLHNNFR